MGGSDNAIEQVLADTAQRLILQYGVVSDRHVAFTVGELAPARYAFLRATEETSNKNLALWPSDPPDHPAARDLSAVMVLLFRDFRDILNEGEPPKGH